MKRIIKKQVNNIIFLRADVNSVHPCLSVSKENSVNLCPAFSLVEMLVVLAIIVMLAALSIPAIKAMQKSFDSTGAEGLISTALATARTLAIRDGQYAGVRFQKVYNQQNPLEANQYMIFVKYDNTQWVCGFSAVQGYKPIKLPENIKIIDKIIWRGRQSFSDPYPTCATACVNTPLDQAALDDSDIANLETLNQNNNRYITDTSTFSIVFSPAGKLVSHEMRCARKTSSDDIFNTLANVSNNPPTGMFVEDDYEDYGAGVEMSRNEFWIYDKTEFKNLTTASQRIKYLDSPKTKKYVVNPYTGEVIKI